MRVDIKESPDGKSITLLEDIWFDYQGRHIRIPAGYRSDGASVPRVFWPMLSADVDPVTMEPSVIHDFLYDQHIGTRLEADRYYLAQLILRGYPLWKCSLTYIGVRAGGISHW